MSMSCYSEDAWEPSMSDDGDFSASFGSPAPVKAKKAGGKKAGDKKAKKPLGEVDTNVASDDVGGDMEMSSPAKPQANVEDTYSRMTQLEHILHRPDTYVGSTQHTTMRTFVLVPKTMDEDENEDENDEAAASSSTKAADDKPKKKKAAAKIAAPVQAVEREVSYVPALYKIFDEILVNAADNKQRDKTMNMLKVDIDVANNTISVWNNGAGIPVEMHQKEGMYVPELIFGHLLTSSNYNDSEEKVVGGRNGFGAKLTNIFSTQFVVETADGSRKRQFKQVYHDNMSRRDEPEITTCKKRDNWTKITFTPDLAKFGMTTLEDDVVAMMTKRVYDVAGTNAGLKVFLNGEKLPVKSFQDYVSIYLGDIPAKEKIYAKVSDRWEVCVAASDGEFKQVSFVNSIWTAKGGKHVDHVADQVVKAIKEKLAKGKDKVTLQPYQIKSHLFVFVKSLIVNPSFDSQTKEEMTTKVSKFGSRCDLSEAFMKKVLRSGIKNAVMQWAKFRAKQNLGKTNGKRTKRITGVPKLEDANKAGTAKGKDCTLILTEGDSAKALAVAGLSVVGRDHYGVFPLRGKLLNVREASNKQIMNNAEITALKTIMGLKHGVDYDEDNIKTLRYGSIMIMTDQDVDGSHIKGLVINFIHTFWPSLLKLPGFLREFITPIVKATKGRTSHTFYTLPEYEAFKEELNGSTKGWTIKYYKGLGTSSAKEAKEYFSDLPVHVKDFVYEGADDDEAIDLAFSKKKITQRKKWLNDFEEGTFLDMTSDVVPYTDFVNQELILFSLEDNLRSIPSMIDGLKPGQRKILFSCFKRDLKKEVKVAQLAGYVSEHSAYHHGEASLAATIVGMAQDFTGSNNINLLMPNGQFGTRHQGGKDAASPRYIFTALNPITRYLFPKADDPLLEYMEEEGATIEPKFYMPIIPLVLVNGADGIGTGWSTSIPNYSPYDLTAAIRTLISDGAEAELPELAPWYRDFTGEIEPRFKKDKLIGYTVTGSVVQISETKIRIEELPIRCWTQSTKLLLESYIDPPKKDSKGKKLPKDKVVQRIKGYTEYHTDTSVCFEVEMKPEQMAYALGVGLLKMFKATTTISVTNMHLFDRAARICKYTDVRTIIREFFDMRLQYYIKRKEHMAAELDEAWQRLDNKARFITAVIDGDLVVSGVKKAALVDTLVAEGYRPFPKATKKGPAAASKDADNDDDDDDDDVAAGSSATKASDYNYLLSMAIWSLTHEKKEKLLAERDAKEAELKELLSKRPEDLWLADLDDFDAAFADITKTRSKDNAYGTKKGGKKGGKKKKKKSSDPWGDSDGEWGVESDEEFLLKPKTVKATKRNAKRKKEPKAKAKAAPEPEPEAAAAPAPSVDPMEGLSLTERIKLRMESTVGKDAAAEAMAVAPPSPGPVDVTATPPAKRQKTKAVAKPKASKKAAASKNKKNARRRPQVVESDSDSTDFEAVDTVVAARTPRAKRGTRAARGKISYADMLGNSDDDEPAFDDEDSGSDAFSDDGSDFESEY